MTTEPTKQQAPPIQFSQWLKGYGSGLLDDQLTASLRECAEQVVLLDKGGTVTLKLSLVAQGGGVVVTPKVTTNAPEAKQGGQFFFVADNGCLSRKDPRQPQLPGTEDPAD